MATEPLTSARSCFDQHDWSGATAGYEAAPEESLTAFDHVQWAMALYWQRLVEPAIDRLETAADRARAGEDIETEGLALRALIQIATWAGREAETATATARLGALIELVDDETEAHAFWQWGVGRVIAEADRDAGYARLEEALGTALRLKSRNAEALTLTSLSQLDSMAGRVDEAMRKVDAAAALALSGEVFDLVAGGVLCGIQFSCRNVGDWARASQWNAVAQRWADRANVQVFPGLCHFHRCEILRHNGDLEAAERQAALAVAELADLAPAGGLGFGYRELGITRLLRGDESGAEEAFRLALDHGVDPNPGLALLRIRRGELDSARRGLEAALDTDGIVSFERPFLLPTLVAVCIALGDTARAETAAAELVEMAEMAGSEAYRAAADQATADLALARGDLEAARSAAHSAWRRWRGIQGLYDAARARETIARVELAAGETAAAAFEFENARRGFADLGAAPDVRRIDTALTEAWERPAEAGRRAFMFTDIVDSTPLQAAIGDERWLRLLEWHDRTLKASFDEFGGEVVKHEGDGFFVSFRAGADALRAGCRIQQALAQHRQEAGFALDVRIGVHEGEATPRGTDWFGANVTLAARIAGSAGAGEVVCTDGVLASAPMARVAERRSLELKGIDGTIQASLIEACH